MLFRSLRSFFTLSFLLLSCRVLFPICGLSFSWVLSGCFLLSYHEFSSLKCFPPLGLSLSVFFLSSPVFLFLPLFFLFHFLLFFSAWLPSFYSKLIQWDFSLLPLELHQLFLVCCGHPFKITHSPIGCPDHCHCSVHVLAHLPCIGWVQVGSAPALLCLLHCLLCLSPMMFLP